MTEVAAAEVDVTYIVISWREESATLDCLESIHAQRGDVRAQIVVVDNEGTDASTARLRCDPRAEVIGSPRNLGFGGGVNLGLTLARAPLVAIINNDCVLDPGWTSAALAVMADASVGVAGGRDFAWPVGTAPGDESAASVSVPVLDPVLGYGVLSDVELERSDVPVLNGSNLMARRSLLTRLRGLDADFFAYYEDADLCLRAWATGARVVYDPAMRVWHRRNLSSNKIPFRKTYLARRNHLYLVAKHFPDGAWRSAIAEVSKHNLAGGLGDVFRNGRRADASSVADVAAGLWPIVNGPRLVAARRRTLSAGESCSDVRERAAQLKRRVRDAAVR